MKMTHMNSLIGFLILLMVPVCASAQHTRDAWYIGFGLGTGSANLTIGDKTQSYAEYMESITNNAGARLGLNFSVGGTLSPHFLLGVELAGVNQQAEVYGVLVQLAHTQILLAGTWFPQGEGAFVKGGVGQSVVSLRVDSAVRSLRAEEDGLGAMLGAGYAFWLGESANLVLGADFHYATFDPDSQTAPSHSEFTLIYLGCSWY